jgi:Tfp pilus assembly protein PilN
MIKINLLPAYILERHRIRRAIGVVVVLLVIELLAFGFAFIRIRTAVTAEQERLDYWTREANKVAAIENLTNDVKARTAPYQKWLQWFTGLESHNARLADMLKEISAYVYNRVHLTEWAFDSAQKTITLTGRTDSLESLARYYLNALRGPFTNVELTTTVSGWNLAGAPPLTPPAGPGGLPYQENLTLPVTLTCAMKEGIVAPGPPVRAATAVGAAAGRPGGPGPGPSEEEEDPYAGNSY